MGKKFVDSEGKEWDFDKFDDSRSWGKLKKDGGFYGHMKVPKSKVEIIGTGEDCYK